MPARRSIRSLAAIALASTLLVGLAPPVGADENDDVPPGAADGVPTRGWDAEVDDTAEPQASPAATTQRYFGREVFEAVQAAAAATPRSCDMSNAGLTALVLAPVFKESGSATSPGTEPSPMTLSRFDEWSGTYPPPETNVNTNYGLYAFREPNTAYPRAYWHPGIGIWQYDSAGVGMPYTAAQRIDVRIVASDVAAGMAGRYSAKAGNAQAKRYAAWAPWGNPCTLCESAFWEMYPTFDNLTLTEGIAPTGGMVSRTCSFTAGGDPFPCHFVDPGRAQGATWWTTIPDDGDPTSGRAPLSAPFYVFERNGFEERHWLRKDTGYDIDISARRRLGTNARPRTSPAGSGLDWTSGSTLCDAALPGQCGSPAGGSIVVTALADQGPAIPLVGDFDGNGFDDLFWYAAGPAADRRWLSNGNTGFTSASMPVGGSYEPLVGDFDGDGEDDIFWYAAGAPADYIWWSGDRATSQPTGVGGSYEPFVGDFDGNGRAEVFWYRPGGGTDYIWAWSAQRVQTSRALNVLGTYEVIEGDFDGDGRDDVFWYRPGPASDSIWYGRPGGFDQGSVGVGGTYVHLVGDYDGDGSDDILWYRPGSLTDFTWFGEGRAFDSRQNDIFGSYEPFSVDFDPASAPGGDDVIFYGIGSRTDVRWLGQPDRTFQTSTQIVIEGDRTPFTGQFAGTDAGDVVFFDPAGGDDELWSS